MAVVLPSLCGIFFFFLLMKQQLNCFANITEVKWKRHLTILWKNKCLKNDAVHKTMLCCRLVHNTVDNCILQKDPKLCPVCVGDSNSKNFLYVNLKWLSIISNCINHLFTFIASHLLLWKCKRLCNCVNFIQQMHPGTLSPSCFKIKNKKKISNNKITY